MTEKEERIVKAIWGSSVIKCLKPRRIEQAQNNKTLQQTKKKIQKQSSHCGL